MSPDTIAYYLLGILVLVTLGFTAGTLIATRMSHRQEAKEKQWDETHPTNSPHLAD